MRGALGRGPMGPTLNPALGVGFAAVPKTPSTAFPSTKKENKQKTAACCPNCEGKHHA